MKMKKLTEHITEALKIGSKSKVNQKGNFTDEELMYDYDEVAGAYTKAEKDAFKLKYGVNTNKIRDIQIEILNYLRDNRNKKTQFDAVDVKYFIRYDLPMKYEKIEEYFKQESEKFLKYVLDFYRKKAKRINPNTNHQSYNDKYTLKRIAQLEKYLGVF